MNHLWKTNPSHMLLEQVCCIYSTSVLLRIHYPSLQYTLNYSTSYTEGPRECNPHSNLLLVGWSGNWIPVEARFSAPVQMPVGPAHHDIAMRLKKANSNFSMLSLNLHGLFYGELYLLPLTLHSETSLWYTPVVGAQDYTCCILWCSTQILPRHSFKIVIQFHSTCIHVI
jgi:hypothetical protein